MEKRPVSDGNAGSTRTSADPDVFRGALVLVAAAAGLVWALAPHGSSEDARNELELELPLDTPKHSK
jgi:hypothetical protein